MYSFKFLGTEAIFDGDSKRSLKCPENCKKQINGRRYYFQKNTIIAYNIPYVIISETFKKSDDKVASRIWESLRKEGWR